MKNIRNKTKSPKRLWDSARIKDEKVLVSEYGLRRKKEIRSAEETLRRFRRRARNLIAIPDQEKEQVLINKIFKLGILKDKSAGLDGILTLTENDVLGRRLQTVVFKKGMAETARHARQHIVHGHIAINGRRTDVPSYMVPVEEEEQIGWYGGFKPKKKADTKGKRGVVEKPKEEPVEGEAPAETPVEETPEPAEEVANAEESGK